MKTLLRFIVGAALTLMMGAVCFGQQYTRINLVSNTAGAARLTDPQLINPWGMSRGPSSAWWISDHRTGFSTVYNGAGAKQSLIVAIPQADPNNKNTPTGAPSGTVFNSSQTDFMLAPGKPAAFLFSTIDGTIAGWNPTVGVAQGAAPPSTHAVTVVKTADGSSYAPWSVAMAPADFGRFSHNLLIGQFAGGGDTQSSGYIAAYDLITGKFNGLLQDAGGKPLSIKGIWSLSPGNVSPNNSDATAPSASQVYFTAGPSNGSGGLFGYLAPVSTDGRAEVASLFSPIIKPGRKP